MGSVVPFSAANDYVSELVGKGQPVRAILDTNVLIAISYEIKEAHEQVVDLIRSLEKMGVSFLPRSPRRPSSWSFIVDSCSRKHSSTL